ncbi:hypothetical protein [Stenotrophomonas sp.]|uniref:hypothetical protein n=1 Tax=Stenotrophomonas sp. TaxID=69392 RepID=UPI0033413C82
MSLTDISKEPASWQLLEFLAGRVRLIRTESGFFTDIGSGLILLDDEDAPPDLATAATAIVVDRISSTSGGRAQASSDVALTIEFSVPRGQDEDRPNRLVHRARHDLLRVLTFDSRSLPLGLTKFEVVDSQLVPVTDDAGHSSVVAQITARAGLTESFQPVSNPQEKP